MRKKSKREAGLVALIAWVTPDLATRIKAQAQVESTSVSRVLRMVLEQHFHGKDGKP